MGLDTLAQGPTLATRGAAYSKRALDLRHERNMGFPAATLEDTTGKAMSAFVYLAQKEGGRVRGTNHELELAFSVLSARARGVGVRERGL